MKLIRMLNDDFQVGEYDSDEGELWADDEDEEDVDSDGSWDTESEHEEFID